jgi:hypothetical protein
MFIGAILSPEMEVMLAKGIERLYLFFTSFLMS